MANLISRLLATVGEINFAIAAPMRISTVGM